MPITRAESESLRAGPAPRAGRLLRLLSCWLIAGLAAGACLAWEARLVDPAGAPVAGALVAPAEGSGGAVTDREGHFELAGENPPPLLLVELADGTVLGVPVGPSSGPGPLEIVIDPARSERVNAVASGPDHLLASPVSPAWVRPEEQIEEEGDRSLQEVISRLPGAAPSSPDPDRVPSIRGAVDGRTLFLLDGGVVATERRAGVSGGGLHPATLAGVEVIRGPGALIYGSGAMGGVVLVRSRWASVKGPRRGEVTVEGRGGDAPSFSASLAYQEDGWVLAAAARSSEDPRAADGRDLEGEYRQRSIFAGRSWMASGALYHAGVRFDALSDADRLRYASEEGGLVVPDDHALRLTFQRDRPGKRDSSLVGWWTVSRRALSRRRSPAAGEPETRLESISSLADTGARWLLHGSEEGRSWVVGLEGRLRYGVESQSRGEVAGLPQDARAITPLRGGRQAATAGFAALRRPIARRLDLSLGARLEPIWTSAALESGRGHSADLAWAASAALTRTSERAGEFSLQVARTFREPTVGERFEESITGRGFKAASEGLKAERALQTDLSWRYRKTDWELGISLFRYDLDDVLERRFGEGETFLGLPVYRFANASSASLDGVEASALARLAPDLSVELSLHRMRGEVGEGEYLADVPADGGRLAVTYRTPRAFLRGEIFAVDRDRRPGSGEAVTPGYGLVHLSAGIGLRPGMEARLHVDNLLDRDYPVSARRGDPLAPGRTFGLSLKWKL